MWVVDKFFSFNHLIFISMVVGLSPIHNNMWNSLKACPDVTLIMEHKTPSLTYITQLTALCGYIK